MDGDGFGGPFDLNSQAVSSEGFPGLDLYGAYLQGDDDGLLPGRGRGFGLPPYRPPRAGGVFLGGSSTGAGGSSSAAAGRGGGNGGVFLGGSSMRARGGARQRANSAAAAPSRRGGQRVPCPRAPRAPRGAVPPVRGQPSDNGDEELENDVEELASSGGPPVSQTTCAQWNDANNACLLELFLEQRAAGTYNGAQMSSEGYQAVVDGLLARRRLVYSRSQVKNQIVVLKNTHSFWRYLQVHTGLGRKADGTIDAESDFWITHTEKKPYLKKLQWGPPANEDLLDQLFRGSTVDGSTAYVPGDDYGENHDEEEFQTTPGRTTWRRRSWHHVRGRRR
ncbi:unnamed protein product [Urochloa decumbens]|uniref:Myb/SANT-like domain-containing protein n=1 Tax=Urochloa decumbens TaxID=240449 RepID=A0ABC9EGX3_9POAL